MGRPYSWLKRDNQQLYEFQGPVSCPLKKLGNIPSLESKIQVPMIINTCAWVLQKNSMNGNIYILYIKVHCSLKFKFQTGMT